MPIRDSSTANLAPGRLDSSFADPDASGPGMTENSRRQGCHVASSKDSGGLFGRFFCASSPGPSGAEPVCRSAGNHVKTVTGIASSVQLRPETRRGDDLGYGFTEVPSKGFDLSALRLECSLLEYRIYSYATPDQMREDDCDGE